MTTRYLTLTLDDGSVYGVPVDVIARNRAENYKDEFANDLTRSLIEDTVPLFESDKGEIVDWAANNMNWSDVKDHATQLRGPDPIDFEEVWRTAKMGVKTV